VSLETLVDSPVIAGAHFRTVDLTPGAKPPHSLHIVADSAAALEIKPEDSRHFSHLVAETGALFDARHYLAYQFLLTLSDHVAHFGTLLTDFRHIKAGQLHRANGGYLMVDAIKLLTQPFAWAALKRALEV
jgi:hypothetical protein